MNTITNEVEEEDSTTCVNTRMTESYDEENNTMPLAQSPKGNMINEEKESVEPTTLRTKMGSNDVSNTPKEVRSTQYVR